MPKPRAYNFETDHFESIVWPALAHRFQQFTSTATDHRTVGGECENFYSLMHAPATGQAIAGLILHRHFQTLDLTRLGWKRVAETGLFRSRASSDACPLQVRSTAARVFSMCRLTCSA